MSNRNDGERTRQPGDSKTQADDSASFAASAEISPSDTMFRGNREHYLSVGCGALALVLQGAARAGLEHVGSILDLPCGFGRVQRWLRGMYPDVPITACDTQAAAVEFCQRHFGARGVRARSDDAHWKTLTGPFDVVWCGSLLTHFDQNRWLPLLHHFEQVVSARGVIIFTAHGHRALGLLKEGRNRYGLADAVVPELIESVANSGFGFKPKSGDYGVSISLPDWVRALLREKTRLEILDYSEAGWDNHQDVVMCRRRE